MIQYVAAVVESGPGAAGLIIGVFFVIIIIVACLMYWSLHHRHQDYDDNDWEG